MKQTGCQNGDDTMSPVAVVLAATRAMVRGEAERTVLTSRRRAIVQINHLLGS